MAAPNKTSKQFSSRLPLELILAIYSYLPTKPLQRLRYVFDDEFPAFSKSLETYSFQHKHAFHVSTNPANAKLLFKAEYSYDVIHEIDSYPFKPPSITHSYNFDQLFNNILPYDSTKFCGSAIIGGINGLICLYFEFYLELKRRDEVFCGCCIPRERFHHLILWNPCTGEHHAIPTPQGFRFKLFSDDLQLTIFGFGYDLSNKTYKLVIGEGAITQFYDLSTDAWKIVDAIDINWHKFGNIKPYHSWQSKPQFGYYLNGALHWIVSGTRIVSINLSTEVSSFLNMPHCCSSQDDKHRSNMGVVNGCLSVTCHQSSHNEVSIWVMKEYGRDESWTNLLNITLSEINTMVIRPPLWVSHDNDEMLFQFGDRHAYWDPNSQELNYVEGLKFDRKCRGMVHVDTLVSPKPEVYGFVRDNDNCKVLVLK